MSRLDSPLKNIRVLDMGWVLAGALPGMILADLGAEVVKVESRQRLDYLRQGRPLIGTERDPEQGPLFLNVNRNKLSMTLDLSQKDAKVFLLDLAATCDVCVENFAPGVLEKLGLGYSVLRRVRPDMVLLSISAAGETAPMRDMRAYGPTINALSGIDSLVGYAGGPPLGIKHFYADVCAALHGAYVTLAALKARRRTGCGQHIRVSMWETAVATLGQAVVDYTMNGRIPQPQGNQDLSAAPYNNYPCKGGNEWISIAVRTEQEWEGLCLALENPGWGREPRFGDAFARRKNSSALDEYVSAWARERSAEDAMNLLQRHGVPAVPLWEADKRLFNPHYKERGLYAEVKHPVIGDTVIYSLPWKLSRTSPAVRTCAPLLGQHNKYIFEELLGLPAQEFESLTKGDLLR